MELQLTEDLKNALEFSREEAERLDNNYISAEHFMLGMLRLSDSTAMQIMSTYLVYIKALKCGLDDFLLYRT